MSEELLTALQNDHIEGSLRTANSGAALAVLHGEERVEATQQPSHLAFGVELVALRLLKAGNDVARGVCRSAFSLLRSQLRAKIASRNTGDLEFALLQTRTVAFGFLGGCHAQVRQLLSRSTRIDIATAGAEDWGETVARGVLQVWQQLIAGSSWDDIDAVRSDIEAIRKSQTLSESAYLDEQSDPSGAWRLIASYHLLRAAEMAAEYAEFGAIDGRSDPLEQMEPHFEEAHDAALESGSSDLPILVSLLSLASREFISNSIWRAARGRGTRTNQLVRLLRVRVPGHCFLLSCGLD